MSQDAVRATMLVRGQVQNVGFRWWTRARALELGLVGHARNLRGGGVEVSAQGDQREVERLHALLQPAADASSRPGHVEGVELTWHTPLPETAGFVER